MEIVGAILGVLILILITLTGAYIGLQLIKEHEEIPTSVYYKKIARLQKEIEILTERKKLLNPLKDGYDDKFVNIEQHIRSKKKEIKRVKVHIKIEDDSHKY